MGDVAERPLGELCEIVPGPSGTLLDAMSAELDNGVPVVNPPDITEWNTVDERRLRRVSVAVADSVATRFRLRAGDVVLVRQVARGAPFGRRARMERWQEGWLFSTSCVRISVTSERLLPEYLTYYLGDVRVRSWFEGRANPGSAVRTLTSGQVARLPVVLPDLDRQRELAGALGEIDRQIQANDRASAKLGLFGQGLLTERLRDWCGGA